MYVLDFATSTYTRNESEFRYFTWNVRIFVNYCDGCEPFLNYSVPSEYLADPAPGKKKSFSKF